MPPIYLDYNATTPLLPEVVEAMRPYLEGRFGNPSSSHWYGRQTRKGIERARGQLASLLGCLPDELVFTSGGSESNNQAIKGAAELRAPRGGHVVISGIEHPAVRAPCAWLAGRGHRITELPVDRHGRVAPSDLQAALRPETFLVSVMHANNEVGTLQPIAELAAITRGHGALFHTDAAQSVGKIRVDVGELGIDLLSVAGHKLYAPKGVGALYIRSGLVLPPLIHGAGHERGLRAGTENALEIAGLGQAAAIAARDIDVASAHTRRLRDRLEAGLCRAFPAFHVNGHPELRLPNTLSASFPGVRADALLESVAGEIAASAGAACHSDAVVVSQVLAAMGVPLEVAMGTIRLSIGRMTTEGDVDRALEVLSGALGRLGEC